MAHRTLIGGTAYNITSGRSMVSGTTYNIKKGRTLVNGTGYDISFIKEDAYAMIYSSGNMVFQRGNIVAEGETLVNSYTGFEDTEYTASPWNSDITKIKYVSFVDRISPISIAYWFNNSRSLTSVDYNNFNSDKLINMAYAYYNCRYYKGTPICGNNVTDMSRTYFNCSLITGNPVCGSNVTTMYGTYINAFNITG